MTHTCDRVGLGTIQGGQSVTNRMLYIFLGVCLILTLFSYGLMGASIALTTVAAPQQAHPTTPTEANPGPNPRVNMGSDDVPTAEVVIQSEEGNILPIAPVVLSVVTPTVARPECDYIHVLAASMWGSTKPEHAGTTVRHWTISSSSGSSKALDSVVETYPSLLSQWWSISHAPDNTDVISNVDATLGDTLERTMWRSKEVLDYVFALESGLAASASATHIVVLQDDVLLSSNWVELLEGYERGHLVTSLWSSRLHPEWLSTVATLYERSAAEGFAAWARERFSEMPIDWLLEEYLRHMNSPVVTMLPGPVQHIGLKSSLAGKSQLMTNSNWGRGQTAPDKHK